MVVWSAVALMTCHRVHKTFQTQNQEQAEVKQSFTMAFKIKLLLLHNYYTLQNVTLLCIHSARGLNLAW